MPRVPSVLVALLAPVALGAGLAAGSRAGELRPGPAAPPREVDPATSEAEQAIRADYRCLGRFDAVDVTAFFFNRSPAEVVLLVGETATSLPQQPAADGARYAAADQSFWIKGDQARWQLRQAPPLRCLPRRAGAS